MVRLMGSWIGMTQPAQLIKNAITIVEQEQQSLNIELQALDDFLEVIRLTTPVSNVDSGEPDTTDKITAAYTNIVMATEVHNQDYEETLERSLEQEFSTSIAESLITKDYITRRQKTNLLAQIRDSIEAREDFQSVLTKELESLELVETKIHSMLSEVQQSNQVIEIAKKKHRCKQLLNKRQHQIQKSERKAKNRNHALNEYLYRDMGTHYPVLSSLTLTIDLIESQGVKSNHEVSLKD